MFYMASKTYELGLPLMDCVAVVAAFKTLVVATCVHNDSLVSITSSKQMLL